MHWDSPEISLLGLGFGQQKGWEMGFGQNLGWEMGFIPRFRTLCGGVTGKKFCPGNGCKYTVEPPLAETSRKRTPPNKRTPNCGPGNFSNKILHF